MGTATLAALRNTNALNAATSPEETGIVTYPGTYAQAMDLRAKDVASRHAHNPAKSGAKDA